jgi:hypothetical protein
MTADAPLYQTLRPSVMRVVRLAARGYSDPAIAHVVMIPQMQKG